VKHGKLRSDQTMLSGLLCIKSVNLGGTKVILIYFSWIDKSSFPLSFRSPIVNSFQVMIYIIWKLCFKFWTLY
jgi:hypothetical protein